MRPIERLCRDIIRFKAELQKLQENNYRQNGNEDAQVAYAVELAETERKLRRAQTAHDRFVNGGQLEPDKPVNGGASQYPVSRPRRSSAEAS